MYHRPYFEFQIMLFDRHTYNHMFENKWHKTEDRQTDEKNNKNWYYFKINTVLNVKWNKQKKMVPNNRF